MESPLQILQQIHIEQTAGTATGNTREGRESQTIQLGSPPGKEKAPENEGRGVIEYAPNNTLTDEASQETPYQSSTFAQVLEEKHPPRLMLIEGFLRQGDKVMLSGPSKAGKSWTLLDICISIACGESFWSRTTSRGKVLYLNFELAPDDFQERIRKVLGEKGIPESNDGLNDLLKCIQLKGQVPNREKLLEMVQIEGPFDLIVPDPWYKLYLPGHDENSNGGGNQLLLAFLDELSKAAGGATILFAHHHAKGNQSARDSKDRAAGGGILLRDVDGHIDMAPHREDGAMTIETVYRGLPPVSPFVVRRRAFIHQVDRDLNPYDLDRPGTKPTTCNLEDIPSEVLAKPIKKTEFIQQLQARGLSRRSAEKQLTDWINEDRVRKFEGESAGHGRAPMMVELVSKDNC